MRVTSFFCATLLVGQNPSDPNTTFQSQAREVLLEVVVRDSHGKLVTQIDASQISVYEDGVRQDIKSLRLVPGREVRELIQKEAAREADKAPVAAPAAAVASPKAPTVNPLRTVNVICLILNDLTPETRKFAFDAARKFVNKEVREDTYIGVFSLDASGMRPVFPFSNNRENLVKAIQLASVNQLPTMAQSSASLLNGLSISTLGVSLGTSGISSIGVTPLAGGAPPSSISAPPPPGVPTNADGSSKADPLGTRGDIGLAVNAGLRELDALTNMVKMLGQLPFQKTILLMSTGITRPTDQLERWKSLISLANKGGVTFYGVDVYGLGVCQDQAACPEGTTSAQGGTAAIQGAPVTTPSSVGMALTQSTAGMSQAQSNVGRPKNEGQYTPGGSSTNNPTTPTAALMESMHQTDYLRFAVLSANTQEALREISESTGGFVIANTNNTDALLAKVMEDVDTHFEIAYKPALASNDGHFKKIEVKLAKADLRVETRSGYYAVPETGDGPLTTGDFRALEALDRSPLPFEFGYDAGAFRFRQGEKTAQFAIAFEVPISNLTATAEAKSHRFHAHLLALVKDEQGEIVARVSKEVFSDIADRSVTGVRMETMAYEHTVSLKPGNYTVETAVIDEEGNRASTSAFKLENRPQAGLGVSDLTLVRRMRGIDRAVDESDPFEVPGKRAQPFVSTALSPATQPYVFFVVYPQKGNAEAASMRADFFKNGRVVDTQKSALPAPDGSGAVPMAIQPVAGAGEYELKVTVEQGHASAERSLKYTIGAQ